MRIHQLLPFLSLAIASPLATTPATETTEAPVHKNGRFIEDAYIVVLKQGANLGTLQGHVMDVEGLHEADPLFTFTSDGTLEPTGGVSKLFQPTSGGHGFYGYAGKFTPTTLTQIRASPAVEYIEHDQIITIQDDLWSPDGELGVEEEAGTVTEKGAPWGLARISHRNELSIGTFTKYEYVAGAGEGVDAYIVDTGVNIAHVEFEGRAKWGKTIPKDASDFDGNGHGTHCAGTVASRKYGVAKAANIIAVKVLGDNGSGTMSDVIDGILWAASDASEKRAAALQEMKITGKTKYKGAVANMSLGGGKSKATDDAVNAAVDSGLHFAVAAGNDNKDACNYSPAAAEKALTVGASSLRDERAYFSNFGACVDIFGPGLGILSTWNTGNQSTNTISGTSMASPHLCGVQAYYLSITPDSAFSSHSEDIFESSKEASTAPPLASLLYANVYSLLPSLTKYLLPTPQLLSAPAPKAPTTIGPTPKQLKNLILALATKGALKEVGAKSPNLLAFNNATTLPFAPKDW